MRPHPTAATGLSSSTMRMLIATSALLLALVALPPVTAADTTYRCPRADGSIEYSSRPCEDGEGEVVELPEVNTFEGRPAPRRPARDEQAAEPTGPALSDDAPAFAGYGRFEITDPTQDKVYWNVGGNISVSISISPRLQAGHGINLYLDGQPVNSRPEATTSFQLTEVWPVLHSVRAEVVAMDGGRVIATTPDVQFQVRQRSVN